MPAQFTDPGWWRPRPPQPNATSASMLIGGTLIPVIIIVAVLVAVVTQGGKKHSAAPQGERSVAAFQVCMSVHGIGSTTKSGSPEQQTALTDCRETLPANTHVANFGPDDNAETRLSECMQDASPGRSSPGGRFGRGRPSDGFLNALTVCRSLVQTGPISAPTAPPQTSTAPLVA